jgi:hypothetical protein
MGFYINYCEKNLNQRFSLSNEKKGLFTDARKRDGRVDEDPGPSQHLQLPRMLRCVSPWNFASAVHRDARRTGCAGGVLMGFDVDIFQLGFGKNLTLGSDIVYITYMSGSCSQGVEQRDFVTY